MSGPTSWRDALTATERYENIQRITTEVAASRIKIAKSAFEIESEAYAAATSREEYDAACQVNSGGGGGGGVVVAADQVHEDPPPPQEEAQKPGIEIGSYPDCHYIASGVTCDVYHSRPRNVALKVVAHRPTEPHNPLREAKILKELRKPCIPLIETFWDQEQQFILVFPYMPLTLQDVLERGRSPDNIIRRIFVDIFTALRDIHSQGIIHRDIKPSSILLAGETGPAYLADFGTAWHPIHSASTEPKDDKILDIGTGQYRAPEVLFGNKAYGPAVDMWAAGVMLAEACRRAVPTPLFESRPASEDGNQLGLILSIFKTIGSPTRETWPEAQGFRTPPFDMYKSFEHRPWDVVLPDVDPIWRELVAACVKYNSSRATAEQALQYDCLREE